MELIMQTPINLNKTNWIPNGKVVIIDNQKVQRGELVNLKRRFETDICKQMNITKKQLQKRKRNNLEFKEEYNKLLSEFYNSFNQ
jgi:hypothetical protein